MKCFYHSADLDGHCSGAIVKCVFPDCEMIGMDYGEAFPWDSVSKDDDVLMIDFSLQPFSDMVRLDGSCRLTWIDHHKSAIESYSDAYKDHPPSGSFHLDTNYAACELTWQYLSAYRIAFGKDTSKIEGKPLPEAVHLLGRYDIWKHAEVTGSLEFQYGMRAFADTWPDSPIWVDLFAGKDIDRVINDGIPVRHSSVHGKLMGRVGHDYCQCEVCRGYRRVDEWHADESFEQHRSRRAVCDICHIERTLVVRQPQLMLDFLKVQNICEGCRNGIDTYIAGQYNPLYPTTQDNDGWGLCWRDSPEEALKWALVDWIRVANFGVYSLAEFKPESKIHDNARRAGDRLEELGVSSDGKKGEGQ